MGVLCILIANLLAMTALVLVPEATGHEEHGNDLASPLLDQGDTYSYQVDVAGTIQYQCTIHPSMRHALVVEYASDDAEQPYALYLQDTRFRNEAGEALTEDEPLHVGLGAIIVWHNLDDANETGHHTVTLREHLEPENGRAPQIGAAGVLVAALAALVALGLSARIGRR